MDKTLKKIQRRLEKHTERCLIDWADQGHGCDNEKALKSAYKLLDIIRDSLDDAYENGRNRP